MDQWLVRTANNIIAGPYPRDQVIKLIQEGKLGLQDEVCQANHYWIFLHENQEVNRQLGIQMPRSSRGQGDDEEITETQTDAVLQQSETALPQASPHAPSHSMTLEPAPQPSQSIHSGHSEPPSDYEGGTAVMSRGTFREAKSGAQSQSGLPSGASSVSGAQATSASHSKASRISGPGSRPPLGSAHPLMPEVQIERTSIWKSFAWLMIFISCLIVYAVLRLLHASQA